MLQGRKPHRSGLVPKKVAGENKHIVRKNIHCGKKTPPPSKLHHRSQTLEGIKYIDRQSLVRRILKEANSDAV